MGGRLTRAHRAALPRSAPAGRRPRRRLLERGGDDQGHNLAPVVHLPVLQHEQLAVVDDLQRHGVLVGDYRQYPRHAQYRSRVDGVDPAAGDRRLHHPAIRQSGQGELGGVTGLPGHFGDPLDSADRHADRSRARRHETSESSLRVRTIRFRTNGIL